MTTILTKMAGGFFMASMLATALIGFLTPTDAFYTRLTASVCLAGFAATLLALVFQILHDFFRNKIWKTEKSIIRDYGWQMHWTVGLVGGLAILTTAIGGGLLALVQFVSPTEILHGQQTLWPATIILFATTAVAAFGHALFEVHAAIDRRLHGTRSYFM